MTFDDAYSLHGPDVEAIATDLGIEPWAADRLINARMEDDRRLRLKAASARARYRENAKRSRLIKYAGYAGNEA